MKNQITRILLGVGIIFMLAASASAQAPRRITIQIPFNFVAAGKHLHAGHYTVRSVSYENEKSIMIRSDDGRDVAIVTTNSSGGTAPQSATLDFRQYGDSYFLAAVSIPGTAYVRALPQTKTERKLARELAERAKAWDDTGKTVTVAGSLQ